MGWNHQLDNPPFTITFELFFSALKTVLFNLTKVRIAGRSDEVFFWWVYQFTSLPVVDEAWSLIYNKTI